MSGLREIRREIRELLNVLQRESRESSRPAPHEYRGRVVQKPRSHVTVRKPRAAGELPAFVETIIREWVRGQSQRWIAQRYGLDRETVYRWVVKHPHEIQRILDELGGYGAYTVSGLRRKAEAMRALGVIVTNSPSHRQQSGMLQSG